MIQQKGYFLQQEEKKKLFLRKILRVEITPS